MTGPGAFWYNGVAAELLSAPPTAASSVVGVRYGQGVLHAAEAFVAAQFLRFPFFQQQAPARPVVEMCYGRLALATPEALVQAAFQRFPFQQAAPAANALVPFRFGQPQLLGAETLVSGQYQRFPFFNAVPPAPANPVIAIRFGQSVLLAREAAPETHPHFTFFPFVAPPPAPITTLLQARYDP
ncbi:MAG: hypothetical protein L0Z53_06500 [Acidobacteriales bacterium]|nr:hypothetical protein [Terriglobales bacterium]